MVSGTFKHHPTPNTMYTVNTQQVQTTRHMHQATRPTSQLRPSRSRIFMFILGTSGVNYDPNDAVLKHTIKQMQHEHHRGTSRKRCTLKPNHLACLLQQAQKPPEWHTRQLQNLTHSLQDSPEHAIHNIPLTAAVAVEAAAVVGCQQACAADAANACARSSS